MKKLLLVVAAAAGLAACTFPQTKMVPVGQAEMQAQQSPPAAQPATSDASRSTPPPAGSTP